MSEQTFEEFVKELEDGGYIDKKGAPLKCYFCDSKNLDDKVYYEDYFIVERDVFCKDCGKLIGQWSYGSWCI